MKCRFHLILICVLTILWLEGFAQEFAHPIRKFSRESGLGYEFLELIEDGEGYVWLMYRDRIERFDGENLDTWFRDRKPLSLKVDKQGQVWHALTDSVFRYHREMRDFVSVATTSNTEMSGILFCAAGFEPGIFSDGRIMSYVPKADEFALTLSNNHQPRRGAKANDNLIAAKANTLYYATHDTIWQHNLSTRRLDYHPVFSPRQIIYLSPEEVIVVNWESKSLYYNFQTKEEIRLMVSPNDQGLLVFDAIPATEGGFLLATSKGLKHYQVGTTELRKVPLSHQGRDLPEEQYRQLYRGKDGRIWACTENSLLYFYDDQSTVYHLKGDEGPLPSNYSGDVRYFAEDGSGMLWLATVDGLTKWDREQNELHTIRAVQDAKDRLNHPSIRGLVFDGKNLIVGQTNHGIWIFNPETESFTRPAFEKSENGEYLKAKLEHDFVNQIYTLPDGNHLVSARDGAYLLSKDTYLLKEIEFPGENENVKFAYGTSHGEVYIGTARGLYRFSLDLVFKEKIALEGIEKCSNWTMNFINDHYLIGTGEGVFRLEPQETLARRIIHELADTRIYNIFTDRLQNLWFVSEDMLFQQIRETKQVLKYGFAENVRGDSYYPNGYHRDKTGRVYLGGANGISIFHPEKLRHPTDLPAPYIRSAYLPESEDSLSLTAHSIELKHFENAFEFTFSVPYFGNRRDLNYFYRLKDDALWSEQGSNPKLTLWNLPSGNYQLQTAVALNNGTKHVADRTLHFRIIPPFWKQYWFYALVILVLVLAIFTYVNSIKLKLRLEERLNSFATSLYGMNNVDDILRLSARQVVKNFNFDNCTVFSIDGNSELKRRVSEGNPRSISGLSDNNTAISSHLGSTDQNTKASHPNTETNLSYPQFHDSITVPIHAVGKLFGVLVCEEKTNYFSKRRKTIILNKISDICSERLTVYLTEEKVRAGIARDLHDEMGSTLTSISILSKIGAQETNLETNQNTPLRKIFRYSQDLMEKMSDLVWVINPMHDSLDELINHLREYGTDLSDKINVLIQVESNELKSMKLNAEQRKNLFLLLKEALNNAAKYSGSAEAKVEFSHSEKSLMVKISDSGVGFDLEAREVGNGLKNIRERAAQIAAQLKIESAPGKGVKIELIMPWTNEK